jgi:Ras GTPase-activating-like protein IQGAP2/3
MYLSVANVPDAETEYQAHEFLDATVQPRPIYISPNEVYAMHALLSQHLEHLVRSTQSSLSYVFLTMWNRSMGGMILLLSSCTN